MSTKKAVKAVKKSVKKEASAQRGNTYTLTAEGKKHLADVSGQGAIIRDCLKSSKAPLTAAAISERVGKALKTANPSKTVAFYLCVWKADGFVKFGK